jgi:hypothetical protein
MNEHHTPADTDAVFGELAVDDAALESVRRAVGRLRDECAARPAPEPRGALSLMLLEPREEDDGARDPWTLPGIAADRPARRGPRLRHRLAVAAAAVVGTAGLATGLAAAQALPAPLQRAMHDVLSFTGVDVPNAPGDSSTPATTSTTGTTAGGATPAPATGADPSTGGLPPSSAPAPGAAPQTPVTLPPGVSVPAVPSVPPTLLPNLTLPSLTLPVSPPPVSTPLTLPTSVPTLPGLPQTPLLPPIPPLIH